MTASGNLRELIEDFTFADLYEDVHNRINLRNIISNILMAICLYEAKSESQNLSKYIEEGITLSRSSIKDLNNLIIKHEIKNHNYVIRVIKDIMSNKGKDSYSEEEYEKYKANFEMINKLLNNIINKKEVIKKEADEIKNFLLTFDKEIEITYEKEDSLYFGYFRRIPITA